jgi:hypothetical protein
MVMRRLLYLLSITHGVPPVLTLSISFSLLSSFSLFSPRICTPLPLSFSFFLLFSSFFSPVAHTSPFPFHCSSPITPAHPHLREIVMERESRRSGLGSLGHPGVLCQRNLRRIGGAKSGELLMVF